MKTDTQTLPQGWEQTTLGEIAQVVSGGTPSTKLETNFTEKGKGISWITPADLSKYTEKFISNGARDLTATGYKSCSAKLLPVGTVILSSRAPIGYVAIAQNELSTNQGFKNFILSDGIISEYVYYYLKSIKSIIESLGSGTTFIELSATNAKKIPIIYPTDKHIQQAIVNKIESLFADIDAGIDSLKNAQMQLKQYRQSLLKNAFNGELTKDWREQNAEQLPSESELLAQIQTAREAHHEKQLTDWQNAVKEWEQAGKIGKKPSKPKAQMQAVQFEENFADLPNGWGAIKINQIADIFTGATPLKSNSNYYENGSIPWVTSSSLNNEFVEFANNFVTDLALKETNLKLLPKHTLLVAMYGEGKTRGKCSELLIEATTNQAIAGIVIKEEFPVNRTFLKFYMFKNYADIRRQSSGGVQPNLNLSLVGNIAFPFPSLAEQTQIVAILEQKLTACDTLATELEMQLKQAELLKQAVLKSAFLGRLKIDKRGDKQC